MGHGPPWPHGKVAAVLLSGDDSASGTVASAMPGAPWSSPAKMELPGVLRYELIMMQSEKKLGAWDGGAVRPAELSRAQAHGQSEAGLGWAKWGATDYDDDGLR